MAAAQGTRATKADTVMVVSSVAFNERITKASTLTAINYPAYKNRTTKASVETAVIAQPKLRVTKADVLVALFRGAEERILRAWMFTQDDHDFYVLQAGAYTYVYDKLTEQWCQWQSPDAQYYFRGADGCAWNGINVCCDPDTGIIYQIDPVGRLDYGTTPITSQVYCGLTERFRDHVPAFMAEVAISQANPPAGIDGTTLSITLDSFDTITWYNHGSVPGSSVGTPTWVRFYGLGLIGSPGRLFRITDTGVARRIDGINLEIGAANG